MSRITTGDLVRRLQLRERIADDLDTDIIVEGPKGMGKSGVTMEIVVDLLGEDFDWDVVFVEGAHDLFRVVARIEEHDPRTSGRPVLFWFDEAVNLIYRLDWNTVEQKELGKLLQKIRNINATKFWLAPDFDLLRKLVLEQPGALKLILDRPGRLIAQEYWKDYVRRDAGWKTTFIVDNGPSQRLPHASTLHPALWRDQYLPRKRSDFFRMAREGLANIEAKQARKRAEREDPYYNKKEAEPSVFPSKKTRPAL